MPTFVFEEPASRRLDQFLTSTNLNQSRSQIISWISDGHVWVNEQLTKPSYKLKIGDQIRVEPPAPQSSKIAAQEIELNILYEDEHLLVLNKKAGMVVHPGAGRSSDTLVNALLAHCGKLSVIGGVERPGIVHRLDSGTSGVMVVAKTDQAHRHLAKQFTDHSVEKIYWAIVYGTPKKEEDVLKSKLGRNPENRKKFAVLSSGKEAITKYQVKGSLDGIAWLEVKIETGRTHQIRVHLTHLGHGLLGDPLYGGHSKRAKNLQDEELRKHALKLENPMLHARRLSFAHPKTGKKMSFEAVPSEEMEWFLGQFKK